ncbi:hypothetical protein C0995_008283 [Termitomyces sp. Mi166|nr:hypothetical protein C0995_008283 [Termitomyces sp. Mi166\
MVQSCSTQAPQSLKLGKNWTLKSWSLRLRARRSRAETTCGPLHNSDGLTSDVLATGEMDFSESFPHLPSTPLNGSARAGPSKSGLTLVLPALKGGKPIKVGKKSGSYVVQEEEKKAPRPVKLKPLKEVLTKLIAQIKKKDDYAFFLQPVDTSQVPGYTDVVKRPMDFGTMSLKVERGKYRSLEDFAADLRLVASNAKAFNPPGSIYYAEAERIEAWGLDHIAKAAATVIQYETDWNIEIEKDDEATPVVIDDDDDYNVGTPMEIDDVALARRSPSVSSQVQPLTSRRGARGPYKKTAQTPSNKVAESVDAEGRLPGSKDGLGVFPPGSDWAHTMLALKLKGKRYKTKKERLRFEKEGPPLHADGSLDYPEMEDPFSVLSALAPELETRPHLTQLHPPLFTTPPQYDPQSQSNTLRAIPSYYSSVNLYFERQTPQRFLTESSPTKRRHWTIIRNPTRSKQKDMDEAEVQEAPPWQTPREIQATDYGSYAALAGALEEEIRQRRIAGREGEEEEKIMQLLRDTLDCEAASTTQLEPKKDISVSLVDNYWSTLRASTAEEYIRDVVYGGVDGLAYVRSLAEFVSTPGSLAPCASLGMSLTAWVEQEIIDPLTEGRHSLLRETAIELARQKAASSHRPNGKPITRLFEYVKNSLQLYPVAAAALVLLMQIETHKIDMGALIKTPEELFQSEEEWAGKVFRERRRAHRKEVKKLEGKDATDQQETEEPEKTWMDVDASSKNPNGEDVDYELEGPEELREVMEYVAGVIIDLDKNIKTRSMTTSTPVSAHVPPFDVKDGSKTKTEDHTNEAASEDPVLRNLRLNLLALAKRAPLDTIARLPKDLVPEHIRHFVPTLSSST